MKRKKTIKDFLFWLFVVACIIIGACLASKGMPKGYQNLNPFSRSSISEDTSETSADVSETDTSSVEEKIVSDYHFRNNELLTQHFEKHGIDMGFSDKESYEAAANAVINNPDALHKLEAEDGDDVYYVEATNEFVVLSTDGYIRTYFLPDSGKKYYDKQ